MTTTTESAVEAKFEELESKESLWKAAAKMARNQPVGVAGIAVVILMIFAAIFAPYLTPYDPINNQFQFNLKM